jgi:GNAT superfamily N-acetyltransferase
MMSVAYPASATCIRPATDNDAPGVANLLTQLGYPCGADEIVHRLHYVIERPDDRLAAVLEFQGEVKGVICATVDIHLELVRPYGWITALSVDAAHRGRGLGALLLEYAEAWLKNRDVSAIIVNSHIRRGDAHRFYERLGYRLTGYRLEKK